MTYLSLYSTSGFEIVSLIIKESCPHLQNCDSEEGCKHWSTECFDFDYKPGLATVDARKWYPNCWKDYFPEDFLEGERLWRFFLAYKAQEIITKGG